MKKDRLSELAVGLSGLSYSEWKQLKMIVDATFRKKKSEIVNANIKVSHLTGIRS